MLHIICFPGHRLGTLIVLHRIIESLCNPKIKQNELAQFFKERQLVLEMKKKATNQINNGVWKRNP